MTIIYNEETGISNIIYNVFSLLKNAKFTAISDYRMSVSCQREERSDYLFPAFAEWRDTAVEAAFRFVSSYDGFREINRKVGWKFRSNRDRSRLTSVYGSSIKREK